MKRRANPPAGRRLRQRCDRLPTHVVSLQPVYTMLFLRHVLLDDEKLVVAVSSTALFDLSAEHDLYKEQGVDAFRRHQRAHRGIIPERGAAFPFIQRLLNLNSVYDSEQPIEVVILSRNHQDAGLRVMDAVSSYNLAISRAFFLAGALPYPYMDSIGAVLYLSTNRDEVKAAVADGFPAATS